MYRLQIGLKMLLTHNSTLKYFDCVTCRLWFWAYCTCRMCKTCLQRPYPHTAPCDPHPSPAAKVNWVILSSTWVCCVLLLLLLSHRQTVAKSRCPIYLPSQPLTLATMIILFWHKVTKHETKSCQLIPWVCSYICSRIRVDICNWEGKQSLYFIHCFLMSTLELHRNCDIFQRK